MVVPLCLACCSYLQTKDLHLYGITTLVFTYVMITIVFAYLVSSFVSQLIHVAITTNGTNILDI